MYEKHGWKLSRVLFTGEDLSKEFEGFDVDKRKSDINALWFTRPNGDGVTWELRHLSTSPYALCTRVENRASNGERESLLAELEDRIRNR